MQARISFPVVSCSFSWLGLTGAGEPRLWGKLIGHEGTIRALAFDKSGALLVSGSTDKTAALWEVSRRERKAVFGGHSQEVSDIVFDPNGKWFVAGDRAARKASVWDLVNKRKFKIIEGGALACTRDGK